MFIMYNDSLSSVTKSYVVSTCFIGSQSYVKLVEYSQLLVEVITSLKTLCRNWCRSSQYIDVECCIFI